MTKNSSFKLQISTQTAKTNPFSFLCAANQCFSELLSYFSCILPSIWSVSWLFWDFQIDTIQLSLRYNNFHNFSHCDKVHQKPNNYSNKKIYDLIFRRNNSITLLVTIWVSNKVDELLNGKNERHKIQMFTYSQESEMHWAEVFIDADKLNNKPSQSYFETHHKSFMQWKENEHLGRKMWWPSCKQTEIPYSNIVFYAQLQFGWQHFKQKYLTVFKN